MVGIDANFSYQIDVLEKICGEGAIAQDLWKKVQHIAGEEKNFFAGNIWKTSELKSLYWTEGKQSEDFKPYHRQTEFSCRDKGLGRPESTFKLIGAKQVGKGGLAAMLLFQYLKEQLGDRISLWPFEKPTDQTKIVLFEIYPRTFIKKYHLDHLGHLKIRELSDLQRAIPLRMNINKTILSDHETDALISAYGLMKMAGEEFMLASRTALRKNCPN